MLDNPFTFTLSKLYQGSLASQPILVWYSQRPEQLWHEAVLARYTTVECSNFLSVRKRNPNFGCSVWSGCYMYIHLLYKLKLGYCFLLILESIKSFVYTFTIHMCTTTFMKSTSPVLEITIYTIQTSKVIKDIYVELGWLKRYNSLLIWHWKIQHAAVYWLPTKADVSIGRGGHKGPWNRLTVWVGKRKREGKMRDGMNETEKPNCSRVQWVIYPHKCSRRHMNRGLWQGE